MRIPLTLAAAATLLACTPTPAPPPPAAQKPIDTAFLVQYAETNKFTLGRPNSFKVTRDGKHVLFLRSTARSFQRDLFDYNVDAKAERLVTTASALLGGNQETLSPEEKARRERLRLTAKGIARFEVSKDGTRILVPLSGKLYVVDRDSGQAHELIDEGGYPNDPTFSPDASKVACVRNGDIYVIDIKANTQQRVTTTASQDISNGLPEFVAQEEMSRFRGYWWSPEGTQIAYQETDTKGMDKSYIADPTKPDQPPESWPYPRPGRANARVRFGVVDVRGGATRWITWDSTAFPYLATVEWGDDAPLVILVQNRAQTDTKLLEVELNRGATRELLHEHDDAWVNLDQSVPRYYGKGRRFLWTSERSGAPVLESHEASGNLIAEVTQPGLGLHDLMFIDEVNNRAFVTASADATDSRLYSVSLEGTSGAKPVSERRSKDQAYFSDGAPIYVHAQSLDDGSVRDSVRTLDGSEIGVIQSVAETPASYPNIAIAQVTDDALNTVIVKPTTAVATAKYPVIVHVYSGPGVRIVDRMPRSYLLDQWIADQGFIVVSIDGRGTPGRTRDFERVIKNDLISVQLQDQVRGLQELGRLHPEMDMSRVGIYGWSFGGYATAHAVMQRPDIFKAGVAGAPVTDWRDYDTHYTERYLGLPENDPDGYAKSSVFTYASKLERPLILVHGTADDNVYFAHSLKLANALFRAGKHVDFLPLVNFTHMVPEPEVMTRLYTRIVEHFRATL